MDEVEGDGDGGDVRGLGFGGIGGVVACLLACR